MTDETPPVVDRLNVVLIAPAAQALADLQARTGLKKVDIANRALQIYEFVDAEMRAGKTLAVIDEDGTVQRVKIL